MKKNDPAHIATDEEIAKIEKLINKEYKKAHKEVSQKLDNYLAAFVSKDEKWQEWVADGKKTEDEYKAWRKGQMLIGKKWEDMRDSLATDYTNAAKISQSITKGFAPEVYAINHNYATFEVEKGSLLDTSYTLYSRETVEHMYKGKPKLYHTYGKAVAKEIKEGKQYAWDRRRITSVLTQAVLQGESIPKITKRLEQVTVGDHKAAIRNARTMMTGVQNAGRIDAFERALKLGIPVKKRWIATLDSRTRHWHRELDGEIVECDEPFENSIGKIMFPGDPEADAGNVFNCRCTLIAAIDGFTHDITDPDVRSNGKLGSMTYEEWLAEKKSTSNPIDLPEKKAAAIQGAWNKVYGGKGNVIENIQYKHTAAEGQALMQKYDQDEMTKQYSGIWANKTVTAADYPGMKKAVNDKKWNIDKQIAKAEAKGDADALAKYQAIKSELLEFEKQGQKYLQMHPELDKAAKSATKAKTASKVKQTTKAEKTAEKAKKEATEASKAAKPEPKPKKVTEKQAAKAVEEAQKKVDDLTGHQYDNIWKDPVTPADYADKKAKIAGKKQYFEDSLAEAKLNGWTAKEQKFSKLLDDLDDFEKNGKAYEMAKKELDDAKKVYEPFIKAKEAKFQAEIDAIKKDMDAIGKDEHFLDGHWKIYGNKKVEDYPDIKKGVTAAKKSLKNEIDQYSNPYYKDKAWAQANLADAKKNLKNLEEYEAAGKKYAKLLKDKQKVEAKMDALKPQPVPTFKGNFPQDAFTPERKSKAKSFTDRYEADRLWRKSLDEQWDDLSDYEKYSVWKYTENSNPLNKPLSGYTDSWGRHAFKGLGNVPWGYEDNWRTLGSKFKGLFGKDSVGHVDHKKVVQNLTKAIDKMSLAEDAWFVRGSDRGGLAGLLEGDLFSFDEAMRILNTGDTKAMEKAFKGQVFTNHAYTSTGIARGTGFGGDVRYKIYAPKGTHAVYAEPASYYGHTISGEELYKKGKYAGGVGGEAEMIFQRGTQFRVTGIKKVGGSIEIEMEVVGQPDYFKTGLEETFNGGKTIHKF